MLQKSKSVLRRGNNLELLNIVSFYFFQLRYFSFVRLFISLISIWKVLDCVHYMDIGHIFQISPKESKSNPWDQA